MVPLPEHYSRKKYGQTCGILFGEILPHFDTSGPCLFHGVLTDC